VSSVRTNATASQTPIHISIHRRGTHWSPWGPRRTFPSSGISCPNSLSELAFVADCRSPSPLSPKVFQGHFYPFFKIALWRSRVRSASAPPITAYLNYLQGCPAGEPAALIHDSGGRESDTLPLHQSRIDSGRRQPAGGHRLTWGPESRQRSAPPIRSTVPMPQSCSAGTNRAGSSRMSRTAAATKTRPRLAALTGARAPILPRASTARCAVV